MNTISAIVVVTNIGFTAAFDTIKNHPSWVAYDLEPSKVVKAERKSIKFKPDPRIKLENAEGLVMGYDCAIKVGWDRGHMVPAADMNWDTNALKQTYYFSNVCPMARHVNRGEWLKTEEEVRRLAQSGTVHVVMFPLYDKARWHCFVGPTGRSSFPDSFVKVAYGYFGVRYWKVDNDRNDEDTKLKDKNRPWLGCAVETDGEEQ